MSNNHNNNGNQVVCVKRSETSITTIFEDMYLNERLVDVTLSCSDGQLQAHKLVLAACSPYFSSLFDNLPNVFHYPVIIIKDLQIEDLRLIMEFMYKGQLTIDRDRLVDLIKCAENLQITGLSDIDSSGVKSSSDEIVTIMVDVPRMGTSPSKLTKRTKRTSSISNNQFLFDRTYQGAVVKYNSTPDKLLEQSMITGGSPDGSGVLQFSNYASNSSSTKNLSVTSQQHQHMIAQTSSIQLQHTMSIDQQQPQRQQISNQLQVLSHSLGPNRTSSTSQAGALLNGQSVNNGGINQQSSSQHRGRVHPCNICWKTFRERANLKRHLQVHSLDRTMYACLDCNKTFSWKDNYIRHTKTAHHMNNARQQT